MQVSVSAGPLKSPLQHHAHSAVSLFLVAVVVTVNGALRLAEEQHLALKLDAEVFQILFVQRVCQGQVGGQSPCQQEPVQGQGRQEPQHHAQLQAHRVAQVGQEAACTGRLVRQWVP